MNFEQYKFTIVRAFLIILVFIYLLVGCDYGVRRPSAEQLLEFENAGPVRPSVDMDRLVKAKIGGGPYRVVQGDVLELTMPAILQVVTAQDYVGTERVTPYVCRVNESGTITLPIVGDIEAAGRTLSQIESSVADVYYPEYAVTRPSVFARVLEHKTAKVSIIGAVQRPGVYSLRSDQMSLVVLIMEAGGIIDEGAARIQIIHNEEALAGEEATEDTDEEVLEQLAELNETEPDISETSVMEVKLTFKQMNPSSTIGQLRIMEPDETTLLTAHLDITREIERQALLEELAEKEPMVSTIEIRQKLCALAELLKSSSGRYNRESETANSNMNSSATTPTTSILQGNAAEQTWGGYAKQNSTVDDPLYKRLVETGKELLKIFGLEKRPETEEKGKSGRPLESEPLVLPIKGLNIPFADVALQDGDSVIVERLQQPLFTVIGLVNRPGNFSYPPDVRYNLMQALAFAGGLNEVAEPRYATVYRLKPDGTIVSATFPVIDSSRLTDASNTLIKPGDIVAVEHTPRTRTALFLDRIFRINIGTYLRLNDAWED